MAVEGAIVDVARRYPRGSTAMTTVPVADTGHDPVEEPVTLADLDASVGTGPDVPEQEVAVRYYTDEAFLTAIRLRRNGRSTD